MAPQWSVQDAERLNVSARVTSSRAPGPVIGTELMKKLTPTSPGIVSQSGKRWGVTRNTKVSGWRSSTISKRIWPLCLKPTRVISGRGCTNWKSTIKMM